MAQSLMAKLPESGASFFDVTLRWSAGTELGLDVQQVSACGSIGLRVRKILRDGVVDAHNRSCALSDVIEVGDTLLAPGVSPECGASKLMQDFLTNDVIKIVVHRYCKSGDTKNHSASALTDNNDQLEGLPDAFNGIGSSASAGDHFTCNKSRDGASAFGTNASTACVSESVDSPWCSEFLPDDEVGLVPISDGQNMAPTSTQEQDFDWDYWEHRLSQPVGSIPEFESIEGSSSREGCVSELPPLEVILDRCGADVFVQCLPDFTLDDLLAFRSKMRHPPAMDEVIEAHKLFATCM